MSVGQREVTISMFLDDNNMVGKMTYFWSTGTYQNGTMAAVCRVSRVSLSTGTTTH
jgi:hypothetical protein